MIRSKSLGIAIAGDTIRLSLVERQLNRFQICGLLQVSQWSTMPASDLKKQIADFLARHKAVGCPAVLLVPRPETIMRQLVLPLEAEANLAKVVEYQLVNLVPAEDAPVACDYSFSRQGQGAAGSLRVSVFLVLRAVLDRYLRVCEDLGIHLARVVPSGVAFANYMSVLGEHFKTKTALFLSLENQICEVVGIFEQRVCVWSEGPFPQGEGLQEFLKTETDSFRSQARLAEDTTIDVFLSGEFEVPDKAGSESFRARCHTLAQPLSFGLGIGNRVVTSREMQEHFGSLAAAVSALRTRIPEPVNLLPADKRARVATWQAVPAYTLVAINCLLLLSLLFRGRIQESIFSAQLGQEISRIEPEVKKVRGVEDELAQMVERANLLLEYKGKNAQVLAALVELSEILPNDTFVADLILKEGIFEINGHSGQAAALPQIIENSPLFRDVEFVAAITRSTVAPDKEAYRVRLKLEIPARVPGILLSPTAVQSAAADSKSNTSRQGTR
jgi:hypothetical protein